MTKRTHFLTTPFLAAFLLVCGAGVQPVAAQETAQDGISDERVTELARGYVELLQAGEFESLWEHLAPEAKERFGTFEQFRSASEGVMNRLGTEITLVEENVEPARLGMVAHKMYHRISHYTGAQGTPVRLTIGLVNDGTIGGMTARPAR